MPYSHLSQRLESGADLTPSDIARLERLIDSSDTIAANRDLVAEGEVPKYVHFMTSGIACRYKMRPDGQRSIMAVLLPGDFCDLHVAILKHMDHSIGALTECRVSRVAADELESVMQQYPAIHRACLWSTLVDEAILREWLVNVGRRPSNRQLAHLFCELYKRLEAVGLTSDFTFRMPFTQTTLGDMLGLSAVHVQRVMTNLRDAGHISLQDRMIRILDFEALAELGEFDPAYLHLA